MDLQEQLNGMMKSQRAITLSSSAQLTLGEMILKLKHIVENHKDDKEQPTVKYDFEYLFPSSIDSWRGSYCELALDYNSYDYEDNAPKEMIVSSFLAMLEDAIGKEFTGYKGGEFTMNKHTPVWVANYGNAGETGVIDIVDNSYEIIIITARCDF